MDKWARDANIFLDITINENGIFKASKEGMSQKSELGFRVCWDSWDCVMNNTIQLSDGDMKCWDDKSILSDNQLEITTQSFHYLKKYPR